MAGDLLGITLSYPSTHSRDDTVRILNAYRVEHPDVYKQWVEIESHPIEDERDALRDIQIDVIKYLQKKLNCTDSMAVGNAWGLMRNELLSILRK